MELLQEKKDKLLLEYEIDAPLKDLLKGGALEALLETISEELDLSDLSTSIEAGVRGKAMVVKSLRISAVR